VRSSCSLALRAGASSDCIPYRDGFCVCRMLIIFPFLTGDAQRRHAFGWYALLRSGLGTSFERSGPHRALTRIGSRPCRCRDDARRTIAPTRPTLGGASDDRIRPRHLTPNCGMIVSGSTPTSLWRAWIEGTLHHPRSADTSRLRLCDCRSGRPPLQIEPSSICDPLLSDDGEKDSCVAALTVRAGPDVGSSGFA
jgi:hypothetical protein